MFFPVLVEDTWEADDVVEECRRLGIVCTELAVEELAAKTPQEFCAESCFMCNTETVQKQLRAWFGLDDLEALNVVPCTYPEEFYGGDSESDDSNLKNLFNRNITKRMLGSISAATDLPIFLKPVSNDKLFDGTIVLDQEDLDRIWTDVKENDSECTDCEVYAADVSKFAVEYRLFIGAGRIYGEGKFYKIRANAAIDKQLVNSDGEPTSVVDPAVLSVEDVPMPPRDFVDEILRRMGGERFWVVDVGIFEGTEDSPQSRWAVVEVNPPFSIDDHGLAIEPYCQYCQDACAWIRAKSR